MSLTSRGWIVNNGWCIPVPLIKEISSNKEIKDFKLMYVDLREQELKLNLQYGHLLGCFFTV